MTKLAPFIFLIHSMLTACAYRFTNISLGKPPGVNSIAIEAVYDTTRTVVPSEILWTELQRAIAAQGKMRITSVDKADALLLVHLSGAGERAGTIERQGNSKDPKGDDIFARHPTEFRNMMRAGSYTTLQYLAINVNVKLVSLKDRKVLFTNSFTQSSNFSTFIAESEAGITSHFLRYEESRHAAVRSISRSIAENVASAVLN